MSVHLLIHDSPNPHWWVSPDIWVVPGTDPTGHPGSPVAGNPSYVWARVSNIGTEAANNTRIDFYWANPRADIIMGVVTPIGSAFINLDPGDTQEVLCLVPWIPVIVNDGHECLLVIAHGYGDTNPLPDPLPHGYKFEPQSHDQIAQLNLSVLDANALIAQLSISVSAIGRREKQANLTVEFGDKIDEQVLAQLDLHDLRPAQKKLVEVSLSRELRHDEHPDADSKSQLEVQVPRGTWVPVFVEIHAERLGHKEYQLVHIVERNDGKIVGGVSYLIVNRHNHRKEQS